MVKNIVTRVKYYGARTAAVGSGLMLSAGAAMAEDGTTTAITSAVTKGEAAVGMVVIGVVGLAALAFGLGMIKSWLGK